MASFDGGRLAISLDFELHWGISDLYEADAARERLEGAREAVPRILDLFVEYGIRATWAVVGMLMCESRDEIEAEVPEFLRPAYESERLSSYRLLPGIGDGEREDPLHFAPSLVRLIRDAPGQEIASHTFSHFYSLEPGAAGEALEADIAAAARAAERRGVRLRSVVFPRNQYSERGLLICRRFGIEAFRGNPPRWMYGSVGAAGESWPRRAARLLEAHLPLGSDNLYSPLDCRLVGGVRNIAASRFWRPAEGSNLLSRQHARRIDLEMAESARRGRLFHLWRHPHNFGPAPENLEQLRRILGQYRRLEQDGMRSVTMAEAAKEVRAHEAGRAAVAGL